MPRLLKLDDLYRLPMPKLFAFAEREGVAEHTGMNRGQLIAAVVRCQIGRGDVVRGSGTLEVLPDGYGFPPQRGSQLPRVARRYLRLAEPDPPAGTEDRPHCGRAHPAAGRRPRKLCAHAGRGRQQSLARRAHPGTVFEDLTPLHPNRRLILEGEPDDLASRVIDLVTPVGMGQRGLIVSPPRAGKTVLLQKMALSIKRNHPDVLPDRAARRRAPGRSDGPWSARWPVRPPKSWPARSTSRAAKHIQRQRYRPGKGEADGGARP